MEILIKVDRVDDDFQFVESAVTFRDASGKFFIGTSSSERSGRINEQNLSTVILNPVRIPEEHIFPLYEPGITVVSETDATGRWIKIPNLLMYDPQGKVKTIASTFLQEVKTLERLSKHPHPNIMKYYGCVVKGDRIVGICVEKCKETLYERTWIREQAVDRETVIENIRRAALHLHSLGFCHNDINISNVMFREDDSVALIDFDSCRQNGEILGSKKGTVGFSDQSVTTSTFENDMYGIRKVNEYLETGKIPGLHD
eukprot:TRINITY_DN195_c0_g2_i1.p1 TRINITY_DN195_c0_g2~~TRINITY_DN195_c0_g2_i1.p1  ORF type:complete len:257 (-),score=33.06 TRINITY_DN195_c0_g2_i1:4604-5374(-)